MDDDTPRKVLATNVMFGRARARVVVFAVAVAVIISIVGAVVLWPPISCVLGDTKTRKRVCAASSRDVREVRYSRQRAWAAAKPCVEPIFGCGLQVAGYEEWGVG